MPAGNGMAFVLVQHLDPTHESMMVDLMADRTFMTVQQAVDGLLIEREHVYVIPPGRYLSVDSGTLRLSLPEERHGARLPFDFLLRSFAEEFEARAICVILSGTGSDGSLGLMAVKEKGGLVIAQDPDEASYDGMPKSAIMTGAVDLVLPAAEIPDALVKYSRRMARIRPQKDSETQDGTGDSLHRIVTLLRATTPYDFTPYKQGTLQRRIERRMGMAAVDIHDMDRYYGILRKDENERDLLAKDLLINVTSFFRDPQVFKYLAKEVVPDLIRDRQPDRPIRIWIAGCSTGEETYSLAMLFREEIEAAKRNIKLQVFASDVDPDAVARAREALYPETIEADVSPERLARFFARENHGYRVLPELRETVVFTVQDVLADPPFSRLDLVSCRNLLIYLRPEAQAKLVSLFHFALRQDGVLLLGSAEMIDQADDRFEVMSKPSRLYRHVGQSRPGELGVLMNLAPHRGTSPLPGPAQGRTHLNRAALADLCLRLVMERGPAVVLINRAHEHLYSIGPIDLYLRAAPGHATQDVLAMARDSVRTKLRSAIHRATREKARVTVSGGQMKRDGKAVSFSIDVRPVLSDGEELLLVCFSDDAGPGETRIRPVPQSDISRVAELEQELEATRAELDSAIQDLEESTEEQKAINEEALSVNEEFQSTNEELLTSKEELQSLNEELNALNNQLQETLERQRTTSNDLQNVLHSTNVATLFLDSGLNIRLFTPAITSLFHIIASDVGRPIADLSALAADDTLLHDSGSVLQSLAPIEREVETPDGSWYIRRILPYRTQNDRVEGVVITYTDITERRRATDAMEAAKRQADHANVAKSRFLAAASHDLRQPLQTLALIHGLLAKTVEGENARKVIARLEKTVAAMSGMLNALLDINQIEAGAVKAEKTSFPINDLLRHLGDEFAYHAEAKGLVLNVVPCGLSIHSDPRLLEQMIRNLLSNALKYTDRGRLLLGCRRRAGMLSIEVWDTGPGVPEEQRQTIFEEYYQIDNPAREPSHGLGLGLSIVKLLGELLGHRITVRSRPGKGSAFSIEVTHPADETVAQSERRGRAAKDNRKGKVQPRTGTILIVEDDPEVRELLKVLLDGEGHRTATARDGIAALELMARETFRPDIILADYNLPRGMNGLQLVAKLRAEIRRELPAIILTGDVSTHTMREIGSQNCMNLYKPVKLEDLTQAIGSLLPSPRSAAHPSAPHHAEAGSGPEAPVIFVVDDDGHVRETIRSVLEENGWVVEDYASCEAFLEAYRPHREGCLLIDAFLPSMKGIELLQRLRDAGHQLPAVMITGGTDVSMAVDAMKLGILDYIVKPVSCDTLLEIVTHALELSKDEAKLLARQEDAAGRIASLTPRQRQIMDLVLAGQPSKNIAADLGISQRTVENHRASIMEKMGAKSTPALTRMALAGGWTGPGGRAGRR